MDTIIGPIPPYRNMQQQLVRMIQLFFMIQLPLVMASWIDIDTPLEKYTTQSLVDGTIYHLVMSDEFNVENRTFTDGHDPVWTALDKSDDDASSAGGGSMQFYNSTEVTTENGFLKITTNLGKTEWNHYDHVKKEWKHVVTNFTSGMMQSWNKFCFTGGIVEVDVIFPGDPYIGGLWPAVWMLGNLGRATYEASTNNIWPWSFDTCDRDLQQAQTISACNAENHFGMHPFQGRGATEIDIAEVMTGYTAKPLPSTNPPISYPYCDLTLQVAPGVPKNRPQSGVSPLRRNVVSANGHTEFAAQTWYDGLEMQGNTSINPFFYGTYLAETKPNEPVTRSKKQAFQADAVGVIHQLTTAHFEKPHTFRLEWQPGPGGRLDWFVKSYRYNETSYYEGDGNGQEWVRAFTLHDESLKQLMGSQIPIEPSYLIFNVAISSTWGFPYDAPDWCPKCYDCDDPRCACAFYPGFCEMLRSGKTAMYIDHVRVYQSRDPDAHVGANHTVGCDPPDYPTREWIDGHEYRYMRNPPFSYLDKHPLRRVQRGGGSCTSDNDCGAKLSHQQGSESSSSSSSRHSSSSSDERDGPLFTLGHGRCVASLSRGMFSSEPAGKVCECNPGFTGPHCLALDYVDDSPSAKVLSSWDSPFKRIHHFQASGFLWGVIVSLFCVLISMVIVKIREQKRSLLYYKNLANGNGKIPQPSSPMEFSNANNEESIALISKSYLS